MTLRGPSRQMVARRAAEAAAAALDHRPRRVLHGRHRRALLRRAARSSTPPTRAATARPAACTTTTARSSCCRSSSARSRRSSIGTEAGAGDLSSGVFRDLVVTGRSRLWLFAVRVPAALIVTLALALAALGISLAAAYGFAGGQPTPRRARSCSTRCSGCWRAQGVLCVIAVGLGSLTGSRATSLVTLIGWQVIAGRLLAQVTFLGSARDADPERRARRRSSPGDAAARHQRADEGAGVAVAVLAIWALASLGAGAWRTRMRDA